MANRIVLKKSSVSSKVPLAGDLEYGELALNYTDEKLYFKNAANVIKSTGTVTSVATSGTVSGLTLSGGTITTTGTITLGGTLAVLPSNFASQTANTVLAAPNGAAGVPTFRTLVAADIPTLNQNTTGTSSGVVRTVAGTTSAELVRGNMGDNDQARILVGATASNAGFLEIATADDGTEPIHVRQYTGVFTTLTRTATLLDGSGNTSFPGKITGTLASGELLAVGSTGNSTDKWISIKSQFGDLEIGRNGNSNTYIYSYASGTFTFTHNGTTQMQFVGGAADRVNIPLTTASTSTTTGALTVAGGVGVGGTVYAGGFNGALTGNASTATTLATGRTIALTGDVTYTSGAFNGSANVTGTATLASVGTAGTYTKVTTDAKGRVTSGTTLAAADIPNLDASKITSGIIDAARLPSYVDDVLEFANLAGFPTTGETGKLYVALDTNKVYRWSGTTYIFITSGAVDSVAGKTGVVTLVKADVGLGNVDNTSDAAKPVSTAQQTALNLKANIASPVFTGNVTGLGVSTGTSFNAITGLATVAPLVAGTAAVGTSTLTARQDHVHPLQTTVSGNAGSATVLQTARTINGVSFNGSANITVTANTTNALTIGTGLSGTSFNGSGDVTIAIDSTVATLTGTQTLTNKTLTSPRVGTGIFDTNGNEVLNIVPVASAVNELSISNAATGGSVLLSTAGTDANINLLIQTKGTGTITLDTGTGAGFIDLKPGTDALRLYDDDSSHYYTFVTGNRTANYNITLPAGNVTLTSGTSVVTTRSISTTAPLLGGGDLSANRTLSLAAGYGDTQNPYASKTRYTFLAAPSTNDGQPTFRNIVAADIPTLNQSTTGFASNVTGIVTIAHGGTGVNTRQAAIDALAGSVTSGQYLRGNGTNVLMSAIQAADVPTLNQNTTGSAATLTTTRTLWGQNFNGSANVTGALSSVTTLSMTGQLTNTIATGTAPLAITSTTRVANLNVATAGTADTLTTTRAINGVNFNGSAAITVPGNFTNRTTNESGHLQFIGTTATGNQSQYTNTNLRVNPATATVTSQTGAFAAPFLLNANTISTSYSIPSGYNAVAAGPVVINNGITVTIPDGSTWVIV